MGENPGPFFTPSPSLPTLYIILILFNKKQRTKPSLSIQSLNIKHEAYCLDNNIALYIYENLSQPRSKQIFGKVVTDKIDL